MTNVQTFRAEQTASNLPDIWLPNRGNRRAKVNPPKDVAVIYARFSSDKQKESSVERQIQVCGDYVKHIKGTLLKSFADRALSGTTTVGRLGLEEMLDAARRGEFGILVVENVDRLARDLGILSTVFKRLQALGIEIHQPGRGKLGLADIAFHGLMGDEGRRLLIERTQFAREAKAKDGLSPNSYCYGYLPIPGRPGERAIVETQADLVREIYQLKLEGMHNRQIAFALSQRPGMNKRWTPVSVANLLRNPLYNGILIYRRLTLVKDPETGRNKLLERPRDEWIVTAVEHLRIVDRDVWEAVQALTAANKPSRAPQYHSRFMLSGKLKCLQCGGGMSIRGGNRSRRFACNEFFATRLCKNNESFEVAAMEKAVIDVIAENILDERFTEAYVDAYNAQRQSSYHQHALARTQLESRVASLTRDLRASFRIALGDGFSSKTIARERMMLETELEAAETDLAALPAKPAAIGIDGARMTMLRGAIEGMTANLPFRPEDEMGMRVSAAFRELVERIVPVRTGHDSFEADVHLFVAPMLNRSGLEAYEGPASMQLRASHRPRKQAFHSTPEGQANLRRLAQGEFALTDAQWHAIEPLVPLKLIRLRKGHLNPRAVVEAGIYISMTGSPWLALPEAWDPWLTYYHAVNKLVAYGVWKRLATVLSDIDPRRYGDLGALRSGRKVKIIDKLRC